MTEGVTTTTHVFHHDGHGTVRVLTDLAGAIAEIYSFDAYGNAIGFDPVTALTSILYSGESFDSNIQQQYLRARWYDAVSGRFNQLDPFFGNLNDPQSFHKYLYTHADPVNGVDPSGMFDSISLLMSIGVGAAIGAGVGGSFGIVTTALHGLWVGNSLNQIAIDSLYNGLISVGYGAVYGGLLGGLGHIAYAGTGLINVIALLGIFAERTAGFILGYYQAENAKIEGNTGLQYTYTGFAFLGAYAGLLPMLAVRSPSNTQIPIGFVKGTGNYAVQNVGRVDHASRHLLDFGVMTGQQGTTAFRDAVRKTIVNILENPLKTFDHVMNRGNQSVKGFQGKINGENVVVFVAKESRGKIQQGELVTAIVPTKQQMINWNLR